MSNHYAAAFVERARQLIGGEVCFSNDNDGYELRGPIAKVEPKNEEHGDYLEVTCDWLAKRSSDEKWELGESNIIKVPLDAALIIDEAPEIAAVTGNAWPSSSCYTLSPKSSGCLLRSQVI